MLLLLSTATPYGDTSCPLVAGPPSPKPLDPPPATVVMVPEEETFRTRLLPVSAMMRLPAPSTATPEGWYSVPLVAAPPSPEWPWAPLPATVVMMPAGESLRIRLLPASAM